MKLKELPAKAERILDPKEREKDIQKKGLKKLIKKLREYEHKTRERILAEPDRKQRQHLEKKILLAHAQRKKALALLGE